MSALAGMAAALRQGRHAGLPLPHLKPMELEPYDGYEERTASVAQANVAAIVGVLPGLTALAVGYGMVWGWGALGDGFDALIEPFWRFFLLFAGGVVVHEALHGIAWRLAGAAPGSVRFGFQWKTLTPYAHSTAAMSARAYRIGAVTPGLVLGLVPGARRTRCRRGRDVLVRPALHARGGRRCAHPVALARCARRPAGERSPVETGLPSFAKN